MTFHFSAPITEKTNLSAKIKPNCQRVIFFKDSKIIAGFMKKNSETNKTMPIAKDKRGMRFHLRML